MATTTTQPPAHREHYTTGEARQFYEPDKADAILNALDDIIDACDHSDEDWPEPDDVVDIVNAVEEARKTIDALLSLVYDLDEVIEGLERDAHEDADRLAQLGIDLWADTPGGVIATDLLTCPTCGRQSVKNRGNVLVCGNYACDTYGDPILGSAA